MSVVVLIQRRLTPHMREVERRFGHVPIEQLIKAKLQQHGNVVDAATDLGIPRPTLYAWMDRFGIKLEYAS